MLQQYLRSKYLANLSDWTSDNSGSAIVEFSLVLPVFLMMLLGMLAYGLYFGTTHSISQLAADGARASVAGLTDSERAQIARLTVLASAGNYPLVDASYVSVQAGPLDNDPTEFLVTVDYDASHLPIWGIAGLLPLPPQRIQQTAVVKRGGY